MFLYTSAWSMAYYSYSELLCHKAYNQVISENSDDELLH